MKPLKLINPDRNVTRQQIAMDDIAQSHRKWIGINGKAWQPVENPQQKPTLVVDEVLSRTLYVVNPQERVSVLRKLLRWVSSWR